MKKLIIISIILMFSFGAKSQTLILTDTLITESADTVFMKWYHEKFIDSDVNLQMISSIKLVKQFTLPDTTFSKVLPRFMFSLNQGDSIKNPYGSNYFTYNFVKSYIYQNGEDMKRTLSLYHLLNRHNRILE